jgi:hypothetical protein
MNRICKDRPRFYGESTAPADSTDFPINFLILFHDLPIDEISLLVGVRTAQVVPDRAVIGRLLADNVARRRLVVPNWRARDGLRRIGHQASEKESRLLSHSDRDG